jgi:hypothetical protein
MKANGNWNVSRFLLVLVCFVPAVVIPMFIYHVAFTPTQANQVAQNTQGAVSCCTRVKYQMSCYCV